MGNTVLTYSFHFMSAVTAATETHFELEWKINLFQLLPELQLLGHKI